MRETIAKVELQEVVDKYIDHEIRHCPPHCELCSILRDLQTLIASEEASKTTPNVFVTNPNDSRRKVSEEVTRKQSIWSGSRN